jgi:uncharacterized membrane protein
MVENIENLRKVKNQFLLLGVLPLCAAIIIGEPAKYNLVAALAVLFAISFLIMTWRLSRVLGLKTWQCLLILGAVILFKNIAVFSIVIILLISKYLDVVKSKGNTVKSEATRQPSSLKERFAASRESNRE